MKSANSNLKKLWDEPPKKIRQTSLTHWTTKEGKKIAIKNLRDPHLLNILNMLMRVACTRKISTELVYIRPPFGGPQGDMARDCFEREFDYVLNLSIGDYLPPIWDYLEAEAIKRHLKIPKFPSDLALSAYTLKLAQR